MFLNYDLYEKYKFYDLELMNAYSKKTLNSLKLFFLSKNYFLREKIDI